MERKQPPDGISAREWQATPESVRQLVSSLLATVGQLQEQVRALTERVNQNSQNSSKPPSSDPPQLQGTGQSKGSGRPRGGQPKHVGKGRSLKPIEQVNRVVVSQPTSCQGCGALLWGQDPNPSRHQVTELPRMKAEVTEYQVHQLHCLACGRANRGEWPAEMPSGSFGERVQATTAYLTGRFGVSRRDVTELMATLFGVDLSLGSIPAQEQRVSQALAEPVAEAHAFIAQQPVANVDETSWPQENETGWLWVGSTPAVTVFLRRDTRGADGAKALLGPDYAGIVGSDRWAAYNWLDTRRRQLCWSHLKRDCQAFVERGGDSAIIGSLLLTQIERFFGLWHQLRQATLTRLAFQQAMTPIRREVEALLELGSLLVKHPKTRTTCLNLLKLKPALWTFVDQAGVEPTNNAAERALRRGVIWRRRCFGSQSQAGSRFVERILTVVTSLRQQQRDVLDYLTQAGQAFTRGMAAPSLVPDG